MSISNLEPEHKQEQKRVSPLFQCNVPFFCIFILSLLLVSISFIFLEHKAIDTVENRSLSQFEVPTMEKVLDDSFQGATENAFADQIIYRHHLVNLNLSVKRCMSAFMEGLCNTIYAAEIAAEGRVVTTLDATHVVYEYQGKQAILTTPSTYSKANAQTIEEEAHKLAILQTLYPSLQIFYASIENLIIGPYSPLNDLYINEPAGRYGEILVANLPEGVGSYRLYAENIDEIFSLWYLTDHHFTGESATRVLQASYEFFAANIPELPALPETIHVKTIENTLFLGSNARSTKYLGIRDNYSFPDLTIAKLKVKINGEEATARSEAAAILNGDFVDLIHPTEIDAYPKYSTYFGNDFGEIYYYNTAAANDRCLLIIGSSFTQTFEQNMASQYREVYVVDCRYYESHMKKPFLVASYIEEKGIDDLLYVLRPSNLADDVWQVKTDIDMDAWYADTLLEAMEEGLIKGRSPGFIAPADSITRAEFVTILSRMSGETMGDATNLPFSDVAAEDWYAAAVQWAYQKGVTVGRCGKFFPQDKITREEMATMISRYCDGMDGGTLTASVEDTVFVDENTISLWATDAVHKIQRAEIINGRPHDYFEPKASATRAESIAMLLRYLHIVEND